MADGRLGGLDAAFLAIETKAMHLHVSAVLLLEASETEGYGSPVPSPEQVYARILEAVVSRLTRVPVLRRRVIEVPFGLGRPFLVDDPEFDICAHVRRAALPRPGTTAQLERVVADVVSRPLDRSRPLWDLVVVEGLDDGRTAVVARLHHAIADGISGLGVLAALFDPDVVVADTTVPEAIRADQGAEVSPGRPESESPAPAPAPAPLSPSTGRVPTGPEVLRVVLDNVLGDVVRSARAAVRGVRESRALVARHQDGDGVLLPRPFDAPRTVVNRAISPDRQVAWAAVPMAVVRHIGVVLDGTVNEVVLTLVGGALRTYLMERGDVPDASLVAMVPVSVAAQASLTGSAGAQGEQEPDVATGSVAAGNRVTGMLVSLATGVEDPVGRFRLVRASSRRAKLVCKDVGSAWLESWADALIPAAPATVARALSDLRLFDHLPPVCNVLVSNVPGGEEHVRFGGLRVAAMYPLGPVSEGVGLNVTVLSYAGTLHIGVQSCRALVPDPGIVAVGMLGELDRLAAAAVALTERRQKQDGDTGTRPAPWWHGDVAV